LQENSALRMRDCVDSHSPVRCARHGVCCVRGLVCVVVCVCVCMYVCVCVCVCVCVDTQQVTDLRLLLPIFKRPIVPEPKSHRAVCETNPRPFMRSNTLEHHTCSHETTKTQEHSTHRVSSSSCARKFTSACDPRTAQGVVGGVLSI
jgi:hypothetical protein